MENLSREERPPSWMWHLDNKLIEWFEEVDRKREEKYGSGQKDDLEQNELTAGLRRR